MDPPNLFQWFHWFFYRCSKADRTDPLDRDTAVPVILRTGKLNIQHWNIWMLHTQPVSLFLNSPCLSYYYLTDLGLVLWGVFFINIWSFGVLTGKSRSESSVLPIYSVLSIIMYIIIPWFELSFEWCTLGFDKIYAISSFVIRKLYADKTGNDVKLEPTWESFHFPKC